MTHPAPAQLQVHLLTISHRHGTDTTVWHTEEALDQELANWCADNWGEARAFDKALPAEAPDGPDAVQAYFAAMESQETWWSEHVTVQDYSPSDQFTSDDVRQAINRAADDVIEHIGTDSSTDAINLVVNAALSYLTGEASTLAEAADANYDDSPDDVLGWL